MCLSILENLQWMLEQVDDTMENQDSVMINGLRTIDRKFLSVYRNPINREAINRKIHSVLQEYNEKI